MPTVIRLNRQPRVVHAQAAIPRPDRCQLNAVCIVDSVAPYRYAWFAQNDSMRDLAIYGATVPAAIEELRRQHPNASIIRIDGDTATSVTN